MRFVIGLLALGVSAVAAVPAKSPRIIGGSKTTIDQYPSLVALLFSWDGITFHQTCGGVILTSRSVLTAAHCLHGDPVNRWRIRSGSTFSNSGGVIHTLSTYIIHNNFNKWNRDNDVAIMRTNFNFVFNQFTQAGSIAGSNFLVPIQDPVYTAGWGSIYLNEPPVEELRHAQKLTVNLFACRFRYMTIGRAVTDNMMCAGWLEEGGRDHCRGDNGGPLYYKGVVVGVVSWGEVCGSTFFPGVYARVSRFTHWIQANT
ncbi:trypsin, alkaline B-like [Manduca sexta]|uniref:Peptidase S1 domain-containing protein n=1 Tax=Manduca sexta TaxID=7130 RepID=A0A922CU04_MANSE|nr:trypsin, alkaline B-like [Manduca sexta]KAG6457878.1 hypothetical protein O3G_MSEX010539 [Manduca sexta]KAG6457879.1 hypothetical protein O3G_MSEX010539 [Manduca sexta]